MDWYGRVFTLVEDGLGVVFFIFLFRVWLMFCLRFSVVGVGLYCGIWFVGLAEVDGWRMRLARKSRLKFRVKMAADLPPRRKRFLSSATVPDGESAIAKQIMASPTRLENTAMLDTGSVAKVGYDDDKKRDLSSNGESVVKKNKEMFERKAWINQSGAVKTDRDNGKRFKGGRGVRATLRLFYDLVFDIFGVLAVFDLTLLSGVRLEVFFLVLVLIFRSMKVR